MLKVHIITQNEPFFIPKMINHLLSNQNANYSVLSFSVMKPQRKSKTLMHWFKERIKIYKLQELLIASFAFVFVKVISGIFSGNINYSARKVFNKYGVPEIPTNDINSTAYIEAIKEIRPDVVISISCPQIFSKILLDIPKKFAINAHGTLLPRHRGVFGTWWTLYSNDLTAGSSIHTIDTSIDKGQLLWQKEFLVEPYDTQYTLAYKTKRDMAQGLVEVLNHINGKDIKPIASKYKETYNRAPGKQLGKEFHRKGKKVIKLSDIPKILSASFKYE